MIDVIHRNVAIMMDRRESTATIADDSHHCLHERNCAESTGFFVLSYKERNPRAM